MTLLTRGPVLYSKGSHLHRAVARTSPKLKLWFGQQPGGAERAHYWERRRLWAGWGWTWATPHHTLCSVCPVCDLSASTPRHPEDDPGSQRPRWGHPEGEADFVMMGVTHWKHQFYLLDNNYIVVHADGPAVHSSNISSDLFVIAATRVVPTLCMSLASFAYLYIQL